MANIVTDKVIQTIKQIEGFRHRAYLDLAGKWTIGYGHAETLGREPIPYKGMRITQAGGEQILVDDLNYFQESLNKLIKVDLPDEAYGGFFLLAYNIGLSRFRKSTALRRLNAGDTLGAAQALMWFNKYRDRRTGRLKESGALTKRRRLEHDMIVDAVTAKQSPPITLPRAACVAGEGGEAKPAVKSKTNWLGAVIAALGAAGTAIQEKVSWIMPYVPQNLMSWILGAMALAGVLVIANRVYESYKGVH